MKYSELNLDPRLTSAIEKLNYVEMTPIQQQTIPHILSNKDVAGLAQTGTGKTAAFLVPLIERILRTMEDPNHERAIKDWNARSFVLILVPTRELADQINDNVIKIAAGTGLKTYPLYGGTGYDKQKEALASGLQFVVSTPGRLMDLYKENFVDLKQVRAIVFDEADRMFDMGFKDDMTYILGRVPRDRQFLVFSATLNFDVLNTAYQFGAEPFEVNISRDQAKADHVKDFIMHLGDQDKPQFLLSILKKENPKQAMIFTNFKHNVDRVATFLMNNNIPAMGISSLMSQSQRNQVIEKFKAENDQNILVATDVAARGLDINGVDVVVNYEMPQDAESYVHRIGRTGRAGREGKAFSLISDRDIDSLYRVEEYTKKKIDTAFLEDAELLKDFKKLTSDSGFGNKFDRPNSGGGSRGGGGRGAPARGGPRSGGSSDRGPRREGGRPERKAPVAPVQSGPPLKLPIPNDLSKPQVPRPQGGKPLGEKRFDKKPMNGQPAPGGKKFDRPARNHAPNGNGSAAKTKDFKPAAANKPAAKSFRNNSVARKTSSLPGNPNASVGQKVKSFFRKIFG
ncbi:MAG: DEAD/DEAH box helicase [Bdellovibrio sp.]|nr:DEAD/DEAH box helicase [Bdellovibrio sp.]